MTISYSGNFLKLLLRWKGSIWRSVWKELIVYLMCYYLIRLFYLVGIPYFFDDDDMRDQMRVRFENLCRKFDGYTKLIPLTFLLGFYVSNVVSRWWRQFETLYWPEDLVSIMCTVIHERDEVSCRRRHTICRYVNLASAMAWRDISSKIRMRFPNIYAFVESGLMTEKELEILEKNQQIAPNIRWMTPLHWVQQIIRKHEEEKKPTASLLNNLLTEVKNFRQSLRKLYSYDWVCVPLVYTQVAALATYSFFFFSLFGRQALLPNIRDNKEIDTMLPIFLIVQFMFFVGWFKVGQDLMRPFGLDDDDIELNYILDRNITTSFGIVDQLQMEDHPPFEDDYFWQNRGSKLEPLPHTVISRTLEEHKPKLHSYIRIKEDNLLLPSCTAEKNKRHIDW